MVADLDISNDPNTLTFPETGEVWEFDDGSGLLESIDDGNGNTVNVTYTSQGGFTLVDEVTHDDGNSLEYDYDYYHGIPWLEAIEDSRPAGLGGPRRSQSSLGGILIQVGDFTDRAGNLWDYGYDSNGYLDTIVDPEGNTTRFDYDADGRVFGVDRDAGASFSADWTFNYGAVSGVTTGSAQGREATWKTTVMDPNGNDTVYHHNRRGEVLRTVDGEGNVRDSDFSARGFVIDNFKPAAAGSYGQSNAAFAYAETDSATRLADSLSSITRPDGATSLTYDPNGPTGSAAPYSPTEVEDPYNRTVTFDYSTTDDNSDPTNSGPGRPHTVTDALGNETDVWYRPDGQVDRILKPAADPNGSGSFDLDRPEIDYVYNGAGQVVTVDAPGPLGDVDYTYDVIGRVATVTDGNADTTTYTYDDHDRIISAAHSTSGDVVSTTYDDVGNALIQTVDPQGPGSGPGATSTVYSYDGFNRAVNETFPGRGQTSYVYDDVGNLLELTTGLNGGGTANVVDYTYDDRNLVDTVSVPGTGSTIDLDHDPAGFRSSTTYPGGIVIDATTDDMGRVDTLVAGDGSTSWMHRDHSYVDGQLDRLVDTGLGFFWDYTYDDNDRLTRATATEGTPSSPGSVGFDESYTYDPRSNRTTVDDHLTVGVDEQADYNLADQLTDRTLQGAPNQTFSYDAAGNQLTGNNLTLGYNDRGQMLTAAPAVGSVQHHTYADNGNTNRLSVGNLDITPSLRGVQAFDAGASVLETLRDPSGTLLAVRDRSAGDWNYVIADGQGSVQFLVEDDATLTAIYAYGPWGTPQGQTGPFADDNPYRYLGTLGYHTDNTTGLIKAGARYYQPDLGRWTQPDPSGLETNTYLYERLVAPKEVGPMMTSEQILILVGVIAFIVITQLGRAYARRLNKRKLSPRFDS